MQVGKKIYFASDFHLGVPTHESSLVREKMVVKWLDEIKTDAEEIYLVGDLFDFWYEYKYTIPKGFTRLLGKLAELSDSGIKLHVFTGNHDLWMKDYFKVELGAAIHHKPITKEYNGKIFFIGHGDGLGPGDGWYKILNWIFKNKLAQWMFTRLHPNLAFAVARGSSNQSRISTGKSDEKFHGKDKELLYLFCVDYLKQHKVNYFVFGHRHLPMNLDVEGKARYVNLGEWFNYYTYAVFDGTELVLKQFPDNTTYMQPF